MSFRKTQPAINPVQKVSFMEPEKIILNNKIPLYFFPSNDNIIKLKMVFEAGSYHQSKPLQAFFCNKLLGEGSSKYSSEKTAELIDFYGARFGTSCDDDSASASVISTKKNILKVLDILEDVVFRPTFPEKEFITQKSITLQAFHISNEKVTTQARTAFLEAIFGSNNYYGYKTKPEDFETLNIEHIKTFHAAHYIPEKCYIILTGHADQATISSISEKLGSITSANKRLEHPSPTFEQSGQRHIYIPKKDAVQTGIRVGKVMFNRLHPDDVNLRVLSMILGGYFGSRLMGNIREDKGYTYGIYSSIISLQHTGYFTIASEVGKPVYPKALDEVYKEIALLQDKPVSEDELELVRNYILGNFLRNTDSVLTYSGLYENILPFGLNTSYLSSYIDKVRDITPEIILNTARSYLDKDTLYEVCAG